MGSELKLQCPCGKEYSIPNEYDIVFVKKDQCEIDILCSNPACFLKELGYIKFKIDRNSSKVKIEVASFYPPYVTWNATRLGRDNAMKLLETHLRSILENILDWKKIMNDSPTYCFETLKLRDETIS
ncbi:MAG: hypothetical protein QXL41_01265 [Desulfurococcaceae archaeon]